MARIVNNPKRPAMFDDEQLDVNELGSETEAEKHMKEMLQKQLKTYLSLKDQFQQHRNFVCPTTQLPLEIAGSCSLTKLKKLHQLKEEREKLECCGLDSKEIDLYLSFKSNNISGNMINPTVLEESLRLIESKIASHNKELEKPQAFSNVKKLTRHEMEIEKSLYSGCANALQLSSLVAPLKDNSTKPLEDAFTYVQSLADKLSKKCRNRSSKKMKLKKEFSEAESETPLNFDSNIHHVIVPLSENEVNENKLNTTDIMKIPRFINYDPGTPNKILYLKNLHSKVSIAELKSLFGCFEEENDSSIEYKICTGRMKGQAFVKFTNVHTAQKALHFANGYLLKEKPIIIEFGKKT